MTRDPRASIRRLRTRIDESDAISAADAAALRRYTHELDSIGQSRIGDQQHDKCLMRLVRIAEEVGGLADALEDKTAAKEIAGWINAQYDNPETNKTYRDAFRSFGKHATEGDEIPDTISWVPTGYPRNYDRTPDPSKMFDWEDHVVPMLDACKNYRDEALIGLAFDIGPRSGSLQDITLGDLTDAEIGLRVTLEDKRGTRSPALVLAHDRVRRWLDVHPAGDDPDAPLWSRLDRPTPISAAMIRKVFRQAADRADMTPPAKPTPTRFRKSSASYFAAKPEVTQVDLENRYGWVRGSDEAARYIAVAGADSDRAAAKAVGMAVDTSDDTPVAPVSCPRCDRDTPRDKDTCQWCGQALSPSAVTARDDAEERVRQTLAELPPETATEMSDVLELLADPGVRAELEALRDEG